MKKMLPFVFIYLLLPLTIIYPLLKSFSLVSDDFALIYNSSFFYEGNILHWFQKGFRDYFINFPEYTPYFTNFIRPFTNLTFSIESFLVPLVGERIYFFTNILSYLGLGLIFSLFTEQIKLDNLIQKILGLILFVYALTWTDALTNPSFRTNILMVIMTLISLFLIAQKKSILLITLSLFMALYSHDVGLVAPALALFFAIYLKLSPHHEFSIKDLKKIIFVVMGIYGTYLVTKFFVFQKIDSNGAGIYVFNETKEKGNLIIQMFGRIIRGLKNPYFYPIASKNTFFRIIAIFTHIFLLKNFFIFFRSKDKTSNEFKDRQDLFYFTLLSFFSFFIIMGITDQPRHNGTGHFFMILLFLKTIFVIQKYDISNKFFNKLIPLILIIATGLTTQIFYKELTIKKDNTIFLMNETSDYYQKLIQTFKNNETKDHFFILNESYGVYGSKFLIKKALWDSGIKNKNFTLVNDLRNENSMLKNFRESIITCNDATLKIVSWVPSYDNLIFWGTTITEVFKDSKHYTFGSNEDSTGLKSWQYTTTKSVKNSLIIVYNFEEKNFNVQDGCLF